MEKEFDAIVIGCGPAGSVFARDAAKAGMRVIALDKRQEIGSPVRCGEGLGLHYEHITGKIPAGCVSAKANGMRVYTPNGKCFEIRDKGTKGYVLERKVFDKWLASQAVEEGAWVTPNASVLDYSPARAFKGVSEVSVKHDGVLVKLKAPLVVSAEGMEALVARQAGFPTAIALNDVDTCYEYELAGIDCGDTIDLYLGREVAPRGYAWVFPKGRHVANVGIGIGGTVGKNPKALLDEFISKDKNLSRGKPVAVKAGVISVGAPLKEFVKDGFMVIGTAARQVDPLHGGGIGLAVEAASMAAETAAKAWKQKDFSKENLQEYEKTWRASREKPLKNRMRLRKVLEAASDEDLNFMVSNISGKELMDAMNGDWKRPVSKLILRRPSLLKVLKALL